MLSLKYLVLLLDEDAFPVNKFILPRGRVGEGVLLGLLEGVRDEDLSHEQVAVHSAAGYFCHFWVFELDERVSF